MEKPDRQEFTREFGARAAAKYATAMRNYRKFLKKQPKPNPKAASEAAKIASAMKREVGTRKSQKITGAMKRDVNTRNSQRVTDSMKRDANKPNSARASTKQQQKPTTTKPESTPVKPEASNKAVKGGYTISPEKRKPGTRGAAEQPKTKTKSRRGSGVKNRTNLQKMAADARRASETARKNNRRLPMTPDKNPSKGDRYKKPFGPIMEYNGTKYVRVR